VKVNNSEGLLRKNVFSMGIVCLSACQSVSMPVCQLGNLSLWQSVS
jgi:hypothetical protein